MKATKGHNEQCPYCKRRAPMCMLVPMFDNDQDHKGIMACQKCKRLIRKGHKNEIQVVGA